MKIRVLAVVGLIIASHALATSAHGSTLSFNFTGNVTNASGVFIGQGPTLTGQYSYDSNLVDSQGLSSLDQFRSHDPGNQALGGWGITVSFGSVTRTTANNQQDPTILHHFVRFTDHPVEDLFLYEARRIIPTDNEAVLLIQDLSPVPPDGVALGSNNLTGSPLTTPLDVLLFDTTERLSLFRSYDGLGNHEGTIIFTLTSITAVPLPATLPLLGAGMALMGFVGWRRKRMAAVAA